MCALLTRSDLFDAASGAAGAQRPPWSADEAAFLASCTGCGDCVSACPEGILVKGRGGAPMVRFADGACTFCGRCADACEEGLFPTDRSQPPWSLIAVISDSCLALRRVDCRVCGERCDAEAIRFRPALGGVSRPEVSVDDCVGCGACASPCPVSAITLQEQPIQETRT